MSSTQTPISPSHQPQTAPNNNVSDWLVESLYQAGIRKYIGIPGGAIEPLLNAIARSQRPGIELVICKHEGAAGFMAEGYYRETGRVAAVFATSGPGATNLITGVASCQVDRVPILVFTGQSNMSHYGKGALQDSSCAGIDVVNMMKSCCSYSTLVSNALQLPNKLSKAINLFSGSSPGSAHLSIPGNVLREKSDYSVSPKTALNLKPYYGIDHIGSYRTYIEKIIDQLDRRVTLVVGERAGALSDELLALAGQCGWRVVAVPRAKGFVDSAHPNFYGVVGLSGHTSASESLSEQNSDLLLIFGARLDECSSYGWNPQMLLSDRAIHFDDLEENLDYYADTQFKLLCRLDAFIKELAARISGMTIEPQAQRPQPNDQSGAGPVKYDSSYTADLTQMVPAGLLMKHLSTRLPQQTRIYADSGNAYLWGIHDWRTRGHDNGVSCFNIGLGFSSMGWAIGAAVGAAVGLQENGLDRLTVCVTGDGSTLMHAGELVTAVQYNLNILYVIINDSGYGMVKHGQRLAGAEQIGYRLPAISYSSLYEVSGFTAFHISSYESLLKFDFNAILSNKGPKVLEVMVDPESVPPMQDRIKSLGNKA